MQKKILPLLLFFTLVSFSLEYEYELLDPYYFNEDKAFLFEIILLHKITFLKDF